MLAKPVFDIVIGAYVLMAAGLGRYLWIVGTRPWTWQRPIPVPKASKHLYLTSGSDYVGFV